jgi:hypothetical protein
MPYVSINYDKNPKAPVGTWVCSPDRNDEPFESIPNKSLQKGLDNCGQCVSYVRTVCQGMPFAKDWKRGVQVRGQTRIQAGTAIATFEYDDETKSFKYKGHAAIYVKQDSNGIYVYDQWVNGTPTPIHPRIIRWRGVKPSDTGDLFYVVE